MNSKVVERQVDALAEHQGQAEPEWPHGVLTSLPQLRVDADRAAVLAYFQNTWALTETLFSALQSGEAYYKRPYHKTRHPLIFYYLHPVTFYVNKLLVAGLLDKPVNPHFEILFETGVDEMSWDDLRENDQTIWPELEEVKAYRATVYDLVQNLIKTHPVLDKPMTMDSPAWSLVMCFEHERIHLETSSVLMRELPVQYLARPAAWPPLPINKNATGRFQVPVAGISFPDENPMLEVKEQLVDVGKPLAWPTFGWDNEYGKDQRKVAGFKAGKMLISNGEFYEFVRCGAYIDEQFWSAEGWSWRRFRNTRWPTFWVQDGPVGSHHYKLRTIFSIEPMQWDWPAVVNYYEAKAYCAWRSVNDNVEVPYRLLSEKEHLALRDKIINDGSHWLPGNETLSKHDAILRSEAGGINHNLGHGSEGPVSQFVESSRGFHDVQGNLWQWSEDTFHPLPKFKIHPYYVDFSTPCFDDQHQMIFGGSFISTGDEASIWARFHFRPHFFQHAGFRLVQGNNLETDTNKYESDAVLNQYMLFHWGSLAEQRDTEITGNVGHPDTGNFILQMTAILSRYSVNKNSVLDLGCAVGRASFELAKEFKQVVGLDFSQMFVDAAKKLQQQGSMKYSRHESGRYFSAMNAVVEPDIDRNRVDFLQGDACYLQAAGIRNFLSGSGKFDAVLLSNLMCRLPEPKRCLEQFVGKDSWLEKDGVLVIASPNSWLEQYTKPDAFLDADSNVHALEKMATLLPGFELLHQQDLPFMIREHRRKYEYIISQVSVWRKRE